MKTKIYILLILFSALQACDLLKEDPEGFIAPTNFYKSANDALAAINSVYDVVSGAGHYNNAMWWVTDMSTDDVYAGPGVNNQSIRQIDEYTHQSINNRLDLLWQGTFDGINRANQVIGRVPGIAMDESLKSRIAGEAHFLRALFYFNLVRLFGDVPLLSSETKSLSENLNVSRAPAEKVYAQIIADLILAEQALPAIHAGADLGRATQGAAKSLLAKVYLTRKEWAKAAEKAKEVIDNAAAYNYGLWDNYAEVFAISNKNGKESVFEAQFGSGIQEGSQMLIFTLPRNTVIGQGFGSIVPTVDIVDSYEPEDERKAFTYYTTYTKNGKTSNFPPHIFKYFDPAAINANTGDANNNYPVLRYADVLLMYAEALNELGRTDEAYPYINQIRERAKLTPLENLDQSGFRDALLQERRLEFAFEGHRWFDLVRMGRLVSTMRQKGNTNIQDYHVLYPIPQREIDVNPNLLPQNPGYTL